MRICLVGKFPPIEGGVSARTHRIAHGLARRGHEVHVVTNAREVESAYRVHMREEDWDRCHADYANGGTVVVHWTALGTEHAHVPMDPAFVTRLASTAITVAREIGADCIFSFYLEPYAVAGHLASMTTGIPHLVKMAGSDRGRLWLQPDMRPVYDAVLQSAAAVFSSGPLGPRLEACGVRPARLQPIPPVMMPTEEFTPDGEAFNDSDFVELAGRSAPPGARIGIYGKLHKSKGTLVLLRAVRELRDRGQEIGVVMMCGGEWESHQRLDAEIESLGLIEAVLRLPFVPPWRVPAFLRSCDLVCSLEQDFPVRGHAPAVFAEGMATGRRVIGSTEVALKQPHAARLVDGYNCFLLRDAQDSHAVANAIERALRGDGEAVGRRARQFAEIAYTADGVLDAVESGLRRATGQADEIAESDDDPAHTRRMMQRLVRGVLLAETVATSVGVGAPNWFENRLRTQPPADAAAQDALRFGAQLSDSLSRDRTLSLCFRSAPDDGELLSRVPAVCAEVTIEHYRHDFASWLDDGDNPLPPPGDCTIATIPGMPPRLVFIDPALSALLQACDGHKTVAEIATEIQDAAETVRRLFEDGLLELR